MSGALGVPFVIIGALLSEASLTIWRPTCPSLSTATKLVCTLEMVREELRSLLLEPAPGDLPRDGGEAVSDLASNMARMFLTPPGALPAEVLRSAMRGTGSGKIGETRGDSPLRGA